MLELFPSNVDRLKTGGSRQEDTADVACRLCLLSATSNLDISETLLSSGVCTHAETADQLQAYLWLALLAQGTFWLGRQLADVSVECDGRPECDLILDGETLLDP